MTATDLGTSARPVPGRAARLALPAVGLGGLLTLLGGSQTWFSAPVAALGVTQVSATGFAAVPGLAPLLLVVAAALVARLLVRGAARAVLAVVAALGSLAGLVSGVLGLGGAADVLRSGAADLTGVETLAGDPTTTAWGPVTLVGLAVLLLGCALLATLRARGGDRSQRYERRGATRPGGANAAPSPVDDWDALSAGQDPSLDGAEPTLDGADPTLDGAEPTLDGADPADPADPGLREEPRDHQ